MARQSLQPSRDPGDYTFVHRLRTRFAETDAMGIIHHAAYLPYLEEARVAFLRQLGHPSKKLTTGETFGETSAISPRVALRSAAWEAAL